MKKKKHSGIFLAVIPVTVVLAAGVAFFYYARLSSSENESCQENVARLQELENSDISQTENQLQALKSQDKEKALSEVQAEITDKSALLSDVEIKRAFSGSVIIGDSITDSLVEYEYLDTDVVISKRGLRIADADEQISTAIGLHPYNIFMAFGSNDLELYEGNSAAFIDAYQTQVQKLSEALPDTSIYINGILPPLPSAIEEIPALGDYAEFNQALEAFCTEMNCTYLDNSFIVNNDESMYEPDGEHVIRDYYPMWLTYMAETAGL